MTAGLTIFRNLSWPVKKKRRPGAGSAPVVTKEQERKRSTVKQRKVSRKPSVEDPVSAGCLEIAAPSTSNLEFRYSWPVEGFVKQVQTCKADGMNSKTFEINLNGILTIWNLSIRFWVGGAGERLANPVVVCLNLVGCKVATKKDVTVRYRFGVYNNGSEEFDMGSSDKANITMEETDKLQSVGYKNIAINDKHLNNQGDLLLSVRLSICKEEEEESHNLSSDLGTLINDEKSSDLILQAGDRTFKVHKNILAARSPVFAKQLSENQSEEESDLSTYSATSLLLAEDVLRDVENNKEKDLNEETTHNKNYEVPGKDIFKSTPKLVINNLPADTVEELLRYIYTDNPSAVDKFSQTLLAASDQFQLPGLKLHCEKHLAENISPLNVATILLLSHVHKCTALKKTALSYCEEHHSYIMKDSTWTKMEEENPSLFSEAISCVAPELCDKHEDCIEKGTNRYNIEMERKEIPRRKSQSRKSSK